MHDHFNSQWDIPNSLKEFREHVKTHFMALAGMDLDYYGADAASHIFNIDGIIFEVLEDPDDGYRSHLGPIEYSGIHSSIFFKTPIATVQIEEFKEEYSNDNGAKSTWSPQLDQGYRLVDIIDGHIWLEFGTGNYDDYYPYFMFRHTPKVTDEVRARVEKL